MSSMNRIYLDRKAISDLFAVESTDPSAIPAHKTYEMLMLSNLLSILAETAL